MSSTVGIQNYLSNVFRQVYSYDTITTLFTPRLELSNIDTYSGNTISVSSAAVGDSNSNVYVGTDAGTIFNVPTTNISNTAVGYGAGSNISNTSNSVFIGAFAGASGSNSADVISIGTSSGKGNGSANIFLGTDTGTVGSTNIFIGHYINPVNTSNQIRIGYSNQIPIAADISLGWVGIGGPLAPVNPYDTLDVSGNAYFSGQVGINTAPGSNTTVDIVGNFQVDDGKAKLRFNTDLSLNHTTLSLSNYTSGTSVFDISGSTKSSLGYSSIQGTLQAVAATPLTIGTLKRGILHISAVDLSSSANAAARILFASADTAAVDIGSNISNAVTSLTLSTSNIEITSTITTLYDWSITYFPLP